MARNGNEARFWDKMARKYAASPISDMAGYERSVARTGELLKPSDSVLEFGCGTGTTALKLAPKVARLLATDLSGEMIAIAREKAAAENCANATFEVATLDAAPWPDASFDAVLGFNVLHLVAGHEALFKTVHRLLKPGGLFISKTPCIKEMNFAIGLAIPLMQAIGKAPYVGVFTGAALEQEIAAAGFNITANERHGSKGKEPRVFIVARKPS